MSTDTAVGPTTSAVAISRFAPLVRRISRALLRRAQDSEDAEQETFCQLLSGLGRFEGRGSLEGWVRRIAVRTCLRIRRRRRWIQWLVVDVAAPVPVERDDGAILKLRDALDRLTPREHAAFVLKYQEGLPFADVAVAMECAEGTARNFAFRASQKLRRLLGGDR